MTDISQENYLNLLTEIEITKLIEYLYSLNINVNWYTIINKHKETNNELFIKQIKSLVWEDHSKNPEAISEYTLKNNFKYKKPFNILGSLMFNIDFKKTILILMPDFNSNISVTVKEYYYEIIEYYKIFFETYNINYEFIQNLNELDKYKDYYLILLGLLTKKINLSELTLDNNIILDYNFPISYVLSENYNKLIMLIFDNINSDTFNFQKNNYYFYKINK